MKSLKETHLIVRIRTTQYKRFYQILIEEEKNLTLRPKKIIRPWCLKSQLHKQMGKKINCNYFGCVFLLFKKGQIRGSIGVCIHFALLNDIIRWSARWWIVGAILFLAYSLFANWWNCHCNSYKSSFLVVTANIH